MTPAVALGTALQLIGALLVGYVSGQWFLEARKGDRIASEWPERLLLSVVGLVGFSVCAMVLNIVTGGAAFGSPLPVPILALGLLVWRRTATSMPTQVPWGKVAIAALILLLLFALPVLVSGTALRRGDLLWHMGWSEQLLAGEPVPEGPAPDDVAENAYPWGFHAVIATLVRLVPGTDVTTALVTLHLLLLFAIPLASACIARTCRARYGWAAAAAASLIGGFGWVLARGAEFVPDPDRALYGADLVIASPNAVYELFPPPLPRELGLVLLAATGVFLARAFREQGSRVVAGAVLGMTGLVSAPAMVGGVVWLLAIFVVDRKRHVARSVGVVAVTAAGAFALWAGPVAANALRYGGFVDITPELGREWSAWTALGSWGLLLPLAGAGIFVALTREGSASRFMLALGAGTAIWLGLAMLRGAMGWTLAGNATLLHQGRVWPVAHLVGAAFAGIAITVLYRRLRHRFRLAPIVMAVLAGVGAISPVLASAAITRSSRQNTDGFYFSHADFAPDGFVQRAADRLGPGTSVRVRGSRVLAFQLFSYSGVRLARYDDPRLEGNDLRVRYRDLATRWNEQVAAEGYEPDFVVARAETVDAEDVLETGSYREQRWALIPSSD